MEADRIQAPGPHPEDQALREEIKRLRASLTAQLLQKDDLLLVQSKRLETAYLRRFGALELKLYEAWCDCLRAKRKVKLIRASQNRRERADLRGIEHTLDEELSCYREELKKRFDQVAGVMERREGPGLSSQGVKQLKELYRTAVKAFHPDLHPGEDETGAQKLQQAMRAYRAGDLKTLRALCDTVDPAGETKTSTLEELRTESARLRTEIRACDRQLEEIKAQYPFSSRAYLEDEAKGKAHEAELLEKLKELRERTAQYEAAATSLLDREKEESEE